MNVWLVWSVTGDAQWDVSLRGVFTTRDLAHAHAARLREEDDDADVRIEQHGVLDVLPERGIHYHWSAHIALDGKEDTGPGFKRSEWPTWLHEERPVRGRIASWNRREPDLYIEAQGYDREAVERRYAGLLAKARRRLVSARHERTYP